jgi:hypothetical protein
VEVVVILSDFLYQILQFLLFCLQAALDLVELDKLLGSLSLKVLHFLILGSHLYR